MNSTTSAVLDCDGEVQTQSHPPLRETVKNAVENYLLQLDGQDPENLYEFVLKQIEVPLIKVVMHYCHHNQSQAAKFLGLSRSTLRKKLKKYDLE